MDARVVGFMSMMSRLRVPSGTRSESPPPDAVRGVRIKRLDDWAHESEFSGPVTAQELCVY